MSDALFSVLPERGVLRIVGDDNRSFLQGLISNDVTKVSAERTIYAALLTPQGKFLHDFFIAESDGALLLDCEAARAADLLRRLGLYRLRAKVTLEDCSAAFQVAALFGAGAEAAVGLAGAEGSAGRFGDGIAFIDPRLRALGARAILPAADAVERLSAAGLTAAPPTAYDLHRLDLGVPDGSRDLEVERALLLESNFEALHGVDFGKGCYMGQELTARTKYRGLVRKRLFRVDIDGPLPAPETPIMLGDKEVGTMRSGRGQRGVALLRLEHVAEAAEKGLPLRAGDAKLTPVKPAWADF